MTVLKKTLKPLFTWFIVGLRLVREFTERLSRKCNKVEMLNNSFTICIHSFLIVCLICWKQLQLFTSLDITVQSLMSAVRLLISSDEKVLAFYLCSTIVQLLVGNYFTTFIIHWIRISGTSVVGKAIVLFIN